MVEINLYVRIVNRQQVHQNITRPHHPADRGNLEVDNDTIDRRDQVLIGRFSFFATADSTFFIR